MQQREEEKVSSAHNPEDVSDGIWLPPPSHFEEFAETRASTDPFLSATNNPSPPLIPRKSGFAEESNDRSIRRSGKRRERDSRKTPRLISVGVDVREMGRGESAWCIYPRPSNGLGEENGKRKEIESS